MGWFAFHACCVETFWWGLTAPRAAATIIVVRTCHSPDTSKYDLLVFEGRRYTTNCHFISDLVGNVSPIMSRWFLITHSQYRGETLNINLPQWNLLVLVTFANLASVTFTFSTSHKPDVINLIYVHRMLANPTERPSEYLSGHKKRTQSFETIDKSAPCEIVYVQKGAY